MKPDIYVGITGLIAIAGPITICCAHFKESITDNLLLAETKRSERHRHLKFNSIYEALEREKQKYEFSTLTIPLDRINNSPYGEMTLFQSDLNGLITSHAIRHNLELRDLKVHAHTLIYSSTINYVNYGGERLYKNISNWLCRREYAQVTKTDQYFKNLYKVETDVPISTKAHHCQIFLLGPHPNYHRRSSIKRARSWVKDWSSKDPEYERIRFYKYRQPRWWKRWFPNDKY